MLCRNMSIQIAFDVKMDNLTQFLHNMVTHVKWVVSEKELSSPTTPFMVFNVTYTICEGHKLDAWRSQSVTPTNSQHDSLRQHK